MIRVDLDGGLGNQMFQYATGLFLSQKWKTGLELDLSSFYTKKESGVFTLRNFELHYFGIDSGVIQNSNGVKKFYFRLRDKIKPFNHYYEKSLLFDPAIFHQGDHLHLHGYFQSEKYFSNIRPLLLKKFDFSRLSFSNLESEVLEAIQRSESIAIHVRRGDYIQKKEVNQIHGALGDDYYEKAINIGMRRISKPKLYFFSDEPEWVKACFLPRFGGEVVQFQGDDAHLKEFYAMTIASVNIIANSSFSWWGAWLNQRNGGNVFAPARWFSDSHRQSQSADICPEIWERL